MPLFDVRGPREQVGSYLAGVLDALLWSVPDETPSHPRAYVAGVGTELGTEALTDWTMPVDTPGYAIPSGGGGLSNLLDGADEAVLYVLAAVVLVIVAIISVPLGLLALEIALAIILVIVGLCLRVAHVRPWTVVLKHEGLPVAAFSVVGWRTSSQLISELRQQVSRGPSQGT